MPTYMLIEKFYHYSYRRNFAISLRIGSGSIWRISLPMYCFCRRNAPCAFICFASNTASRRLSSSGSRSRSEALSLISSSPNFCRAIYSRFLALLLGFKSSTGYSTPRGHSADSRRESNTRKDVEYGRDSTTRIAWQGRTRRPC